MGAVVTVRDANFRGFREEHADMSARATEICVASIAMPSLESALPHGCDKTSQSNYALEAELLLREIAQWPLLDDFLAEEIAWRTHNGGERAFRDAGICRQGHKLSFAPDSAVASGVVRSLLTQHSALRQNDDQQRSWAICRSNLERQPGVLYGISCFQLSQLGEPTNTALRQAQYQDQVNGLRLVLWLAREAKQRNSYCFELAAEELLSALWPVEEPSYADRQADLEAAIGSCCSIWVRELNALGAVWMLAINREEQAAAIDPIGHNLAIVTVSTLTLFVLDTFLSLTR
jgi:hypothetical protein